MNEMLFQCQNILAETLQLKKNSFLAGHVLKILTEKI